MIEQKIEVLCRAEQKVIGIFETHGPLNAEAMRGVERRDVDRYPVQVLDGTPMQCLHCHSQIYFRDENGIEYVAIPGTLEILEDKAELDRRNEAQKAKVIREAAEAKKAKESRRG